MASLNAIEPCRTGKRRVMAPLSSRPTALPTMSLAQLPPADTVRWVVHRKAAVVAAIRSDLLTRDDAKARYGISEAELQLWECAIDSVGTRALRVTQIQYYRPIFDDVDLNFDRDRAQH